MVLDGLPSTFIHVRQQLDVRRQIESLKGSFRSFHHLQHAFGPSDDYGSQHALQMLSRCNVHDGTLQEALVKFQALAIYALSSLFGSDQTDEQSAHLLIRSMKKVANDFVSYAPRLMPAKLPPWESWGLAESVRRTILMVYLIRGAYSSLTRGFCKQELFTEALPLDARGKLWTAESRIVWEACSATTRRSPEADGMTSRLLSFPDFNSTFAKVPYDPSSDSYLRLLLIAHHGKAAMDRRFKAV